MSTVRVDSVLVPLDGSEVALRALPTAFELAGRFGAELHTFTVAANAAESQRLAASIPTSLQKYPGDKRVRVEIGDDPAEAIARRAGELGSTVVCLTTRSRGRLEGAVLGSVARSVIQRSVGPTVTLGPQADNPGWSPPPRDWPKPLSVPRIVACVDGTETSEEVLSMATGWAVALDMSLTILTVVGDTSGSGWSEGRANRYGPATEPDDYIEALVQKCAETLPDTDGVVVRDPLGPARGVQAHLDKRPAGLVAVTTHARSGMHRVRLGATAATIVRSSVVPCLVAPVAARIGST